MGTKSQLFAVVLAGGRSSRLHASAPTPVPDKTLLRGGNGREHETLVGTVVREISRWGVSSERCVVVGPENLREASATPSPAPLFSARRPSTPQPSTLDTVRIVREDPPFSGPAAGIRAGLLALETFFASDPVHGSLPGQGSDESRWVLVLGGDMPHVGLAVPDLLAARDRALTRECRSPALPGTECSLANPPRAFLSVDRGIPQPLACLLDLDAALGAFAAEATHASVKSRLRLLAPVHVRVPDGSCTDIDTWHDAVEQGFTEGTRPFEEDTHPTMSTPRAAIPQPDRPDMDHPGRPLPTERFPRTIQENP